MDAFWNWIGWGNTAKMDHTHIGAMLRMAARSGVRNVGGASQSSALFVQSPAADSRVVQGHPAASKMWALTETAYCAKREEFKESARTLVGNRAQVTDGAIIRMARQVIIRLIPDGNEVRLIARLITVLAFVIAICEELFAHSLGVIRQLVGVLDQQLRACLNYDRLNAEHGGLTQGGAGGGGFIAAIGAALVALTFLMRNWH